MTRPPGRPFDPPADLAGLCTERPLCRFVHPDGTRGWLATSHAMVRAILADNRFSIRPELMTSPFPETAGLRASPPPPGVFTDMDPPEHTRYRPLLTGQFTVRRMRALTTRIEEIAAEQLDVVEHNGSPADLVELFANPVPALLICELLDIPATERVRFQRHARTLVAGMDEEAMTGAWGALEEALRELILAKRADPGEDMLSQLADSDLSDAELVNIGIVLLGAGLDTTANMLGLGTFALLCHPEQFALLRTEPEIADRAVEELLRYLSILPTGARAALEDVELGGQLIKAGETVVLSMQAANRDPARYPDPDTLNLRRDGSGQLSFGHGLHQCLGQQLARVTLRTAFPVLAARFPKLRLTVPVEQVPVRDQALIHGVHELPVAWD
ncbi:cytochrome P450 [Sciscionella marina]|uniref:cytochrome P450 n=1 Tax=Sciscionella marina TaxID=508770 RepID=UPI00036B6DD8|nr:cytochrome P450 [Sciscionella marina]